MHPILARGAAWRSTWRCGRWRACCSPALLGGTGGLDWTQSLASRFRSRVTYAFFCLSAWYVVPQHAARGDRCRPPDGDGAHAPRASAAPRGCVLARGWIEVLARRGAGLDAGAAFDRMRRADLRVRRPAVSAVAGGQLPVGVVRTVARDVERRALEVQVLAREAELRSLRAQIDPHFLFNSLHSISALTTADPPAARRMCVLLAEFLRDSLALGGSIAHPAGARVELAERFLEIERVRFGDRLAGRRSTRAAPGRAWCRRCCCSRSSRTR